MRTIVWRNNDDDKLKLRFKRANIIIPPPKTRLLSTEYLYENRSKKEEGKCNEVMLKLPWTEVIKNFLPFILRTRVTISNTHL